MHIGEFTNDNYINYIVTTVNKESPDIIVLTGDTISQRIDLIENQIHLLKNLKSKYGKYAVLGNREIEFNPEKNYESLFQNLDITLLNDSKLDLEIDGFKFSIAGINDTNNLSIKKLKSSLNLPSIFLTHQPKSAVVIKELPNIDLILCGHTHGGQIRPFGLKLLKQQKQPFFRGLYQVENTKVYVSQGAGYTLVPIRFLTQGEISLISINN